MRKLLFFLLILLMAPPVIAEGQVMTSNPNIRFEENQDEFTIIVEGNGMLTVQVLRDHGHDWNYDIVLDEAQVEGYYEYTIQRSYDESFEGQVIASAQEDGKLPSEAVTSDFVMRSYFIMPLPEITFTEEDYGVTCAVTNIFPTFEISVSINDQLYLNDSYSGGDVYSFFIPRAYEPQSIFVEAINKGVAHGDIERGATEYYFLEPLAPPVAATPAIEVVVDDLYVTVRAYSVEENAMVHLFLDDVAVENPCTIERGNQERVLDFSAFADGPDMQQSDWIYESVWIPPLPFAAIPKFVMDEDGDIYTITAYSEEEDATVHLFLKSGEEVNNPFTIERSYELQEIEFMAYAEAPGKQRSEYLYFCIGIEPFPPVIEQTSAPTISCEYVSYPDDIFYVHVVIASTEPSEIHYYCYSLDSGIPILFMESGGEDLIEFVISEPGHYVVEAFATAVDKLQSDTVSVFFDVYEPPVISLYDFEEDGVFYKITSDGKVSVCSETTDYNAYSGDVSIPTTVTHEGVTYMVTAIDEHAFRNCTGLTSVSIGAYVTIIGDNAFYGCTSLTSITLGDYVTHLGKKAFAGCSTLAEVKMGSGMRHIDEMAFQGCNSLTSVTCKAATPPYLFHKRCFDCYSIATLHVYPAVLDSYQSSNTFWSQFATIVAEDKVAPVTGDTNGDGLLNISDVTRLINMLLSGH